MQYVYSRVSTLKQDTENQLSKLREQYPTADVIEETASGAKSRPGLKALVAKLCRGDELIVAALDRLGRRTSEVLALIEDLEKRGVVLKSLREGVDYSTVCGRLVTQILCSVAEMERGLIGSRTRDALAAKRQQGIIGGRRPTYSAEVIARVRVLRASGLTVRAVALETGVSASRVSQLTRAVCIEGHGPSATALGSAGK
jgi:putative DNA-invertase from lambdoid prophage Rac